MDKVERARAIAEQLSQALREKNIGRYEAIAFVNRHEIIAALAALHNPASDTCDLGIQEEMDYRAWRDRALSALEEDAERPLASFKRGDPGKHVQTLLPTPEWKAMVVAAEQRGVSLSLFVRIAIRQHVAWLEGGRNHYDPSALSTIERDTVDGEALWQAIRSYKDADETIVAHVHPDGSWDVYKPEVSRELLARPTDIGALREALQATWREACDYLDHYAEFIRSVHSSELERHPYLPALERVAAEMRQALSATPEKGGSS